MQKLQTRPAAQLRSPRPSNKAYAFSNLEPASSFNRFFGRPYRKRSVSATPITCPLLNDIYPTQPARRTTSAMQYSKRRWVQVARHAAARRATPQHAAPHRSTPRHAAARRATQQYATARHATPPHSAPRRATQGHRHFVRPIISNFLLIAFSPT